MTGPSQTSPGPCDALLVIYCADESHEGKRFEWQYARHEHPLAGRIWVERTHVPKASRSNEQTSLIVLQGNNVLPDGQALTLTGKDESRHKYRFKCKLCDKRFRARGERLDPIFDTIVDSGKFIVSAGVSEVSLTALAARLAS